MFKKSCGGTIPCATSFLSSSKFCFDDFQIEYTDTEYKRGLTGFYTLFYNKIHSLINTEEKSEQELKDWEVIKKMICNPDALKK